MATNIGEGGVPARWTRRLTVWAMLATVGLGSVRAQEGEAAAAPVVDSGGVESGAEGRGDAANAEVGLTVRVLDEPIIVQPSGGVFDYILELENRTAERQAWWVWIDILNERGGVKVLRGPVEVIAHPGLKGVRAASQGVPAAAPGGEYVVKVYAGKTFLQPVVETSFGFEKLGPEHAWEPSLVD